MATDDEIKNVDFNLWTAYEEIKEIREVVYKNILDVSEGEIQDNLRVIYEKIGVFLQIRTTDERCVRIIHALMKETSKIVTDYVPLKKIYQIDNDAEKIEKIGKEVEIATKHIRGLVSDILDSLLENKKKHLSQICTRYLNMEKGKKDEMKEKGDKGGTQIWSRE